MYDRLSAQARGENPGLYAGAPHVIYRVNAGPGVNSLGFADEEWTVAKTPGVVRIACLGASTTQDGTAPGRPCYPFLLEKVLREDGLPDAAGATSVEVMNFGVNGWTSAETLVNYALDVRRFEPDVVIVQQAVNDVWPRLWPGYVDDYRHYRAPWRDVAFGRFDGWLFQRSRLYALWRVRTTSWQELEDRNTQPIGDRRKVLGEAELEPETTRGFRGNLEALVRAARADGAFVCLMTIPLDDSRTWGAKAVFPKLIAGTREHNQVVREVAASEAAREGRVALIDIAADWDRDLAGTRPFFVDFCHVNAAGNEAKARKVAEVLRASGALERPSGEGD